MSYAPLSSSSSSHKEAPLAQQIVFMALICTPYTLLPLLIPSTISTSISILFPILFLFAFLHLQTHPYLIARLFPALMPVHSTLLGQRKLWVAGNFQLASLATACGGIIANVNPSPWFWLAFVAACGWVVAWNVGACPGFLLLLSLPLPDARGCLSSSLIYMHQS
jgi:hypothetical protein